MIRRMFTLRFDMRAPESGAPAAELYQAALDMAAWSDTRGGLSAMVCEHHMSSDGYLPSPMLMASAIAARTERLRIMVSVVLLPLYDPVRLAAKRGDALRLLAELSYNDGHVANAGRLFQAALDLVDDPARVADNRARATDAVAPGARLVTVYQVHGADVVSVSTSCELWPDDARPHADALVTDRPGLALGILTADCAPILLADEAAGVIGAAHAGWKGALAGVAEATVSAMVSLGADRSRIAAAVGPCIAKRSYEVDDAFRARFAAADPTYEAFFADGTPGHHRFDLEGFVAARLSAAGVRSVDALGLDTYADPDRFFSYRRATHRNEPDYGRQLSLIALAE